LSITLHAGPGQDITAQQAQLLLCRGAGHGGERYMFAASFV
jgi:hypothetical protein